MDTGRRCFLLSECKCAVCQTRFVSNQLFPGVILKGDDYSDHMFRDMDRLKDWLMKNPKP